MKKSLLVVFVSVVALALLMSGCALNATSAPGSVVTLTPNYQATTEYMQTLMVAMMLTPTATEAPTETEASTPEPTQAPICDTPSIMASSDGINFTEYGEYLNTELGERMTFTNRKVVIPTKEWNEELTLDELKLVEETWLEIHVCVPETTTAKIFAGGFEKKLRHYDSGVIITLAPGEYDFKLRNGEVIIWYPDSDEFIVKDLERIIEQIKVGNFDIDGELSLLGVTADILPQIPTDMVKDKNVQIIPDIDITQ